MDASRFTACRWTRTGAAGGPKSGRSPIEPAAAKDKIEPSKGQQAMLTDPGARNLDDSIRDVILVGLGPNLSAIRANLQKTR